MRQCIAEMGVTGVEVAEEREQYPDPYGHYLDLARAYSGDLPDPGGEGTEARAVRDQIFLPNRDFCPTALKAMDAEGALHRSSGPFWRRTAPRNGLKGAMAAVNTAVTDLFMLWPYLPMQGTPPPIRNDIALGERPW